MCKSLQTTHHNNFMLIGFPWKYSLMFKNILSQSYKKFNIQVRSTTMNYNEYPMSHNMDYYVLTNRK